MYGRVCEAVITRGSEHTRQVPVGPVMVAVSPRAAAVAADTSATLATDGIDFINEDDARRVLFGVFEHVADTGSAHTDEHFDEIRTRNAEKRHFGFTGDALGQQGLAGAGGADQ